jgi:hypothetical protein
MSIMCMSSVLHTHFNHLLNMLCLIFENFFDELIYYVGDKAP